jgi:hypothetical protein
MVTDPALLHDIREGMERMFDLLEQTGAVVISGPERTVLIQRLPTCVEFADAVHRSRMPRPRDLSLMYECIFSGRPKESIQ